MKKILKSKFVWIISYFEKSENGIVLIDKQYHSVSGKQVREELNKYPNQIVYEEPKNFQMGMNYILADGSKMWSYQLNG